MPNIKNNNDEEELEFIDLEEYAALGKKPGRAKAYKVRVDKEKVTFLKPIVTGEEILSKVGKSSNMFKLFQRIKGQGKITIAPNDKVDLTKKGVERFSTQKQNVTDG